METKKDKRAESKSRRTKNYWLYWRKFKQKDVKFRDPCRLTRAERREAHEDWNIKVIQVQSSVVPFVFHEVSKSDSGFPRKTLTSKKRRRIDYRVLPTTVETSIS